MGMTRQARRTRALHRFILVLAAFLPCSVEGGFVPSRRLPWGRKLSSERETTGEPHPPDTPPPFALLQNEEKENEKGDFLSDVREKLATGLPGVGKEQTTANSTRRLSETTSMAKPRQAEPLREVAENVNRIWKEATFSKRKGASRAETATSEVKKSTPFFFSTTNEPSSKANVPKVESPVAKVEPPVVEEIEEHVEETEDVDYYTAEEAMMSFQQSTTPPPVKLDRAATEADDESQGRNMMEYRSQLEQGEQQQRSSAATTSSSKEAVDERPSTELVVTKLDAKMQSAGRGDQEEEVTDEEPPVASSTVVQPSFAGSVEAKEEGTETVKLTSLQKETEPVIESRTFQQATSGGIEERPPVRENVFQKEDTNAAGFQPPSKATTPQPQETTENSGDVSVGDKMRPLVGREETQEEGGKEPIREDENVVISAVDAANLQRQAQDLQFQLESHLVGGGMYESSLQQTHERALVPQGIGLVQRAIEADKAGMYEEALALYRSAIDLFDKGLKFERNKARKNLVVNRTEGFLERAEQLANYLNKIQRSTATSPPDDTIYVQKQQQQQSKSPEPELEYVGEGEEEGSNRVVEESVALAEEKGLPDHVRKQRPMFPLEGPEYVERQPPPMSSSAWPELGDAGEGCSFKIR